MSGHSHWAGIKRRKEAQDAKRGVAFQKLIKDIIAAAREGGGDPNANFRLKVAIDRAKAGNVPADNIDRGIKRGTGELGGPMEEIYYEGYGPDGVAVMVDAMTDNRNRTAGDVRHYFDKYGGNMGQSGSVSFMFTKQGVIIMDQEDVDEEKLMEDALEAGATDFLTDDGIFEIRTDPYDCGAVSSALAEKGYSFLSAETAYIPSTYVTLSNPDELTAMSKMLDMFDDNDDIQGVWHNCDNIDDAE